MSELASPPPVLIGGTGRSGTTIAGELVGASSHYVLIPIELRFHVERGGLLDLALGKVGVSQFEDNMMESWYYREPNNSGPRGVHVVLDRPGLREALERLHHGYGQEPWLSCGRFLDDVMQPYVRARGGLMWVEMTPPNARYMNHLAKMLPTARFVHMARDGRDVVSSVVGRWWGPVDVTSAMSWWGGSMKAIGRATAATDPDRVITMRLESLVGPNRAAAYEQIADFLGLQGDAKMHEFFDASMSEGQARAGRWRQSFSAEQQAMVEELYAKQLARLERAGTPMPPIV